MNQEYRCAKRKAVAERIDVWNAMLDVRVGVIGNISETGMLLISSTPVTDDALYQFRFGLPVNGRMHDIEVGAHQVWTDVSRPPGQLWVGFRFIDIAPQDLELLRTYIGPTGD